MSTPRGSLVALVVLVLTVLLGSSALHTLMTHFAPQLNGAIMLLWVLTYVAAFMGLMFSHGINWISWLSRYRILLVILLLGTTLSVSWSLDAAISAERVVHLMGCSILAIYLGFMIPLLTTLRVTAFVMGIIMIASLAAAMFMPSVGMQEYEGTIVWSGILNSKNALGFWAAIAVLLYVTLSESYESVFMKLVCFAMALLCLYVLIESDSATSLLAMLVGGSLSLYLYIAFRFQLGFIRMVVLAILLGGLLGFALSNIDTAQVVGRSGDLTGRGEVWRQTWLLIMKKPLTGYGYGALWFPNDATIWIQQSLTDFTWVVYHAHNGFLQVASEIGLPLSCIALLMVAQQLIEIFYCQYQRQQVGVLFVLSFVVAYLISNFSEARFLVNRELYWIFFLALPISMLRQINVVSLEQPEEDDVLQPYGAGGANAYDQVPPDKPWLRPLEQKEALKIGTAGASFAGATAGASKLAHISMDDEQSNHSGDDINIPLPHLKLEEETDIDLGDLTHSHEQFDIGDMDASEVGDATLDNTHVMTVSLDDPLVEDDFSQYISKHEDEPDLDTSMVEDDNVIDGQLEYGSKENQESVIRPYDEYSEEPLLHIDRSPDDFNLDDTHFVSDRYEKDIFKDDDEGEWEDITPEDTKS